MKSKIILAIINHKVKKKRVNYGKNSFTDRAL
nr:MAG TPA: hypothetical protein [Caudoviricetes sp.]